MRFSVATGIGFALSSLIWGLFVGYIGWRGMLWIGVLPALSVFYVRRYGDSVGPDDAGENNINYSFRAMARDQVEVREKLGCREFFVAGHNRGARTTARMRLHHADRVRRAALIDILPGPTPRGNGHCAHGIGH
jgi:pimeloyl-ACP methyl ester carboxylesterase